MRPVSWSVRDIYRYSDALVSGCRLDIEFWRDSRAVQLIFYCNLAGVRTKREVEQLVTQMARAFSPTVEQHQFLFDWQTLPDDEPLY